MRSSEVSASSSSSSSTQTIFRGVVDVSGTWVDAGRGAKPAGRWGVVGSLGVGVDVRRMFCGRCNRL